MTHEAESDGNLSGVRLEPVMQGDGVGLSRSRSAATCGKEQRHARLLPWSSPFPTVEQE
jgi:hypothetical protein